MNLGLGADSVPGLMCFSFLSTMRCSFVKCLQKNKSDAEVARAVKWSSSSSSSSSSSGGGGGGGGELQESVAADGGRSDRQERPGVMDGSRSGLCG